jgi:hypothetical protein
VRDLETRSGIPFATISKFENGRPMRESNRAKLAQVFEAAGVEILNGNAPGARLKPSASRGCWRVEWAKSGGFTARHDPEGYAPTEGGPIFETQQQVRDWLRSRGLQPVDAHEVEWR